MLYADISSDNGYFCEKNERLGLSKIKIHILFYGDNPGTAAVIKIKLNTEKITDIPTRLI
jgi:hypothetical protein